MLNGGHSQSNIAYLEEKGIKYLITSTYKNGVRVGGVEHHKETIKNLTGLGQSWLPDDWSDDDVLVSGTYIANKPEKIVEIKDNDTTEGFKKYSKYKDVTIGVIVDVDGNVGTIYPDLKQREVNDIND